MLRLCWVLNTWRSLTMDNLNAPWTHLLVSTISLFYSVALQCWFCCIIKLCSLLICFVFTLHIKQCCISVYQGILHSIRGVFWSYLYCKSLLGQSPWSILISHDENVSTHNYCTEFEQRPFYWHASSRVVWSLYYMWLTKIDLRYSRLWLLL